MDVIGRLKKILDKSTYARTDKNEVIHTLKRLDVKVPKLFEDFFLEFAGPFWEEKIGMEFLDIVDDKVNIESVTNECRRVHLFPKQYLVLTEMVASEVIVLNTLNNKIYRVDFEGGDEALLSEQLEAEWENFEQFLIEYFDLC
mgnify:CR=1 FL=1